MKTTFFACCVMTFLAGSAPAWAAGEKAVAEIKGRDGKDHGMVTVIETTSGVMLKVKLKGLPPGPHGFHLHDSKACEGDFSSAGAIYNPLGAKHGFMNDEGPMAGDLPNLIAMPTGDVDVEILSPFITLNKDAEQSVMDNDGASLVIFERADDYTTDPEGNAGTRIACGALVPAKN